MLIQELIPSRMKELGLTRKSLGNRIPGRNRAKVFRSLDAAMGAGESIGDDFSHRLATALELDTPVVLEAFEAARTKRYVDYHQRMRAVFTPHLWALSEHSIPTSIMTVCLMGVDVFRRADLPPDIPSRPIEEQKTIVKSAVARHLDARRGNAGPFGRILGYHYFDTYDTAWEVDLAGGFTGRIDVPREPAMASLRVGGRTLQLGTQGLLGTTA